MTEKATMQSDLEGNRLAIIIGASEYKDNSIPTLRSPANDAKEVSDILSQYGFDIKLLLGENVTSSNIRRAISDSFSQTDPYDLILFYFSGHGLLDGYGNGYIATYDTERDQPSVAAISIREVIENASQSINKRNIVMIFDCSYGGVATEVTRSKSGLYIIASTTAHGQARQDTFTHKGNVFTDKGTSHSHGIFSFNLIEGLAGSAFDQSTGDLTLAGLYEYMEKKMAESGSEQKPSLVAGGRMENIIIAISPKRHSEDKKEQNTEQVEVVSNQKSENKPTYSIELEPSLKEYLADISPGRTNDMPISATFIANKILKWTGSKNKRIRLNEESSSIERKTLSQWEAEVSSLYDSSKVRKINERMYILGLSLFRY
jgi:Caspase domain